MGISGGCITHSSHPININIIRRSDPVAGHGRESEGAIVVMKRGNSRGAKDPCRPNCFIRSEEIRLDKCPTTEEHGGLNWDQQLAGPDVKSGITLSKKISELRWKLAHKAKQEVNAPSALWKERQSMPSCNGSACGACDYLPLDSLCMPWSEIGR